MTTVRARLVPLVLVTLTASCGPRQGAGGDIDAPLVGEIDGRVFEAIGARSRPGTASGEGIAVDIFDYSVGCTDVTSGSSPGSRLVTVTAMSALGPGEWELSPLGPSPDVSAWITVYEDREGTLWPVSFSADSGFIRFDAVDESRVLGAMKLLSRGDEIVVGTFSAPWCDSP